MLTAAAIHGLARHFEPRAALPALIAFLFSPFALLWSRAGLIEYMATAAMVGSAWAMLRWRDGGSWAAYGASIGLAAVGMLVKITTGVIWLPLILVGWRRNRIGTLGVIGIALGAGLAWTQWTDSVKAASPATAFLTSVALRDWVFGTLAQRLDALDWGRLGLMVLVEVAALAVLFLAVPFYDWAREHRIEAAALLAVVLAGPLVFTNLYFEHDYYEAAISPAVAAIIGLACSRATRQRLIGAAAAWIVALAVSAPVWAVAYDARADPEAVLPVAKQIAARTSSDELVAVVGRGWDPSALYYARRRGYAVPVGQTPNLDGYRVFVSTPGSRVVTEIP